MNEKINLGGLIGNRDIYFHKSEYMIELFNKYNINFVENNDNRETLVLDKNGFIKSSENLFNNIDVFRKYIKVHFIDLFLSKYKDKFELNEIYLYPTKQGYETDTFLIAKIIQDLYDNVIIEAINFDPRDFLAVKHFFDKKINFSNQIFIQASSGVPATRFGLYFSVLFKKNVRVFEIKNESLNFKNLVDLEREILKERIISNIKSYNYESLSELFKMGYHKKFVLFADTLNNRINFNLKDSEYKMLVNSFKDIDQLYFYKNIFDINNQYEFKFLELINSIIVKLKKEQYLDFISRLFSFEDNMYQYLVYLIYSEKTGKILKNDEREKFFECPKNSTNNALIFIKKEFASLLSGKILKSSIYNKKENKFVVNVTNGRVFYFYFLYDVVEQDLVKPDLKKKIKSFIDFVISNFISSNVKEDFNNTNVMAFRNKTIVAHGLKGINKKLFEPFFELDSFEDKLAELYEKIFEVGFVNIFNEVNDYLISKINEK
jgi:hypothetical protein